MELVFLYPRFLLLLFLVPFFIIVYFFSIVYNKKKAMVFANFEAMERFYDMEFFSKNFMALYFNLAVLILLVFSLAGVSISFNADTSDFSYVIAIDTSGSMATADVLPNRLDAARESAKDLVNLLPIGVDIGVIGFAGDAVIFQDLDTSKIRVRMALDEVDYGSVQGTNIYNALIKTNSLFGVRNPKAVILISDGQLNIGDAPEILNYVKRNNLIVYTIAVGTQEGGVTGFNTISKVDEDFLKALALESGGEFFRATDSDSLETSFTSLIQEMNREVILDLTFYLMLIVVGLFSVLWVLYCLRFKVVP